MIGLDTNVLARVILADDIVQTRQSKTLLHKAQQSGEMVFVCLGVVLELEWVLRSAAKLPKQKVITVMRQLLETAQLQIEQEPVLEHALYLYDTQTADFAECLFAAQYERLGCRNMVSFDEIPPRMVQVVAPSSLFNELENP
jgi:predicted nucleic-acid-binding protein